jgi:hypothetical protein
VTQNALRKTRNTETINQFILGVYINPSCFNLLIPFRLKLLWAIARNREQLGITSKEFIQKHNLGAASSISTAIKSLLEKEFIYIDEGNYYLIDRFFSGWLSNV